MRQQQDQHDDSGANQALLTNSKNGISIINNTKLNNINNANVNNTNSDRNNINQNNNLIDEGYRNVNSVYKPTTISIKDVDNLTSRNNNTNTAKTTSTSLSPASSSSLLQPPIKRNNSNVSNSSGGSESGTNDLLAKGNQLGIPVESRMSRWIPKDQRELLEKQAQLLASRITKPQPAQRSQQSQQQQQQSQQHERRQETEI